MNLNSKFVPNKSEETNQKPAGGFLIAHFKRYTGEGRQDVKQQ